MNKLIILLGICLSFNLNAQTSTIEDINNTVSNGLELFSIFKKKEKLSKPEEPKNTNSQPKSAFKLAEDVKVDELDGDLSQARARSKKLCAAFCIENQNKRNARIEMTYRETMEKNTILVMGKDKSCLFDVPHGVYSVKVYFDDKLVKKTDYKVTEEDEEIVTLPE